MYFCAKYESLMKLLDKIGRAFSAVLKPLEGYGAFVVFMYVLGLVAVYAVVGTTLTGWLPRNCWSTCACWPCCYGRCRARLACG